MGDATVNTLCYHDNDGDRLVVTTGGRLHVDGGTILTNVREAAICGSCGNLPAYGDVVVGNSSAAIIHYQLPVPESSLIGSILNFHAIAFDDSINSSTHWYVAGTSGTNWAVGVSTSTKCIIFDSTYSYSFDFKLQAASTNLWKVFLPGTTGNLSTALVLGTTITT